MNQLILQASAVVIAAFAAMVLWSIQQLFRRIRLAEIMINLILQYNPDMRDEVVEALRDMRDMSEIDSIEVIGVDERFDDLD